MPHDPYARAPRHRDRAGRPWGRRGRTAGSPWTVCLLAICTGLSACATGAWQDHEWFLHRKGVSVEGPQRFHVCHSYGCDRRTLVGLEPSEWNEVRAVFAMPAADAAEERRRIADAVAVMERRIGTKLGTERDRAGTFTAGGGIHQLDCVDETVNTTVLLSLLTQEGLLRWHRPRGPAARGHFINGWPHQSAAVTEIASDRDFAVDSWFHDNGQPAEVVPLEAWLDGWSPAGFDDALL